MIMRIGEVDVIETGTVISLEHGSITMDFSYAGKSYSISFSQKKDTSRVSNSTAYGQSGENSFSVEFHNLDPQLQMISNIKPLLLLEAGDRSIFLNYVVTPRTNSAQYILDFTLYCGKVSTDG
jgi:hypothetical protein